MKWGVSFLGEMGPGDVLIGLPPLLHPPCADYARGSSGGSERMPSNYKCLARFHPADHPADNRRIIQRMTLAGVKERIRGRLGRVLGVLRPLHLDVGRLVRETSPPSSCGQLRRRGETAVGVQLLHRVL
jgi:hypothetical protein